MKISQLKKKLKQQVFSNKSKKQMYRTIKNILALPLIKIVKLIYIGGLLKVKNSIFLGLRNLSLRVKDIVCELKTTTYKEVAETLIYEFNTNNTYQNNYNVININILG